MAAISEGRAKGRKLSAIKKSDRRQGVRVGAGDERETQFNGRAACVTDIRRHVLVVGMSDSLSTESSCSYVFTPSPHRNSEQFFP